MRVGALRRLAGLSLGGDRLIQDAPQARSVTKADAPRTPLPIRRRHVFGHEHDLRGAADKAVLSGIGFGLNQREYCAAVRRRDGDLAVAGLHVCVERDLESELVEEESEAALLISDVDVDRMEAQVTIVADGIRGRTSHPVIIEARSVRADGRGRVPHRQAGGSTLTSHRHCGRNNSSSGVSWSTSVFK